MRQAKSEHAVYFGDQGLWQTRLRKERIATGGSCPLLIGLERTRRENHDRLALGPRIEPQAPDELDAVERTGHANPGHDDIGPHGHRQCVRGIVCLDRDEMMVPEELRVHPTIVIEVLDQQDGGAPSVL